MNIQKLTIRNFRSIGPQGVSVEFATNFSAFVGRNNSGKSNIIAAIDLVLGGYWPREDRFSIEDFYQKNVANDIEITVYFASPLPYEKTLKGWYTHKSNVHGFLLEYKAYKRATKKARAGELHMEYLCVDAKGKPIRLPTEPPSKRDPQAFKKSFTDTLYVTKALRDQVQTMMVPVFRNANDYSPSKSRTLLGSLVKKISESFAQSGETIVLDDTLAEHLGVTMRPTRRELFDAYIRKANATLQTEDLSQLAALLHKYVSNHVGAKEAEATSFQFRIAEASEQNKNMELVLTQHGVDLPADRLGQGLQSLLVLAIFRSYLEARDQSAVFLVEEPEMFLHSHAKRYFYSVLRGMADSGSQIIISTHATEFVDVLNYRDVKRVAFLEGTTHVYPEIWPDLDSKSDELLKFSSALNNERSELFFADLVLLVEGATEKLIYDLLLRKKGIEPDLNNVSIIETSGKGSMHNYIHLLNSLNIDSLVIYDSDILTLSGNPESDAKTNESNRDASQKNERIMAAVTSDRNAFVWTPYFEVAAGITTRADRKNESKPVTALRYFEDLGDYESIKRILPGIVAPVERANEILAGNGT